LLVLYVGEDNDPKRAKAPSKTSKTVQWAAILICLPVAALVFFGGPSGPAEKQQPKTPDEMRQYYDNLELKLAQLEERPDCREMAERVRVRLKAARAEQIQNHNDLAYRLYQRVVEELETDLGTPVQPRKLPEGLAETLREVQDYVNQQLLQLSPTVKKRS
jgi:hypothetical protein